MVMAKFKLGQKVLLLLVVASLAPLLIVNFLLLNIAEGQFRQEANDRQRLTATKTADQVDNFLGSKVNILIFQSQTSAIRKFDVPDVSLNLAAMIKQDHNLRRVALVDKKGDEKVVVNRDGLVKQLTNVATTDSFKATTFLAGKEYIGPVSYDTQGQPHVEIAVPLIRFTEQQDLTHLSTAELSNYRTPDDIQGVLVADFDLSDLWQSVLSTRIGKSGYAYVVDDKGNLIAHPDNSFLVKHQNLANVHQVADFLKGIKDVHESISETSVPVLSTYEPITRTNWAVIVEEPTRDVFASITAFYRLGIGILLGAMLLAIGLSLFFRKRLLGPIRQLAAGARRLGRGEFTNKIPVQTHDELGELAETFNNMGQNIQGLVTNLQTKNLNLTVEQRKLASIIKSVSDGVIALNHKHEIVSINPPAAKLIGKQPKDLIGQALDSHFHWQHAGKPFELNFSQPGIYVYDELVLPQADQNAYVDLVLAVIDQPASDVAAIITVHNLTQSRELEVMKLDFVAIAAHELRTPLTVVRGYLNLINTEALNQLSIMNIENLQRAIVGTEQLSNLINNLLNVSRIERGEMSISLAKVDLATLANEIIEQQRVMATLKEQKLRYDGPERGVYVPADKSAISEVINNLINNAMKYTQAGGVITVSLRPNGDVIQVEVSDNGPGIPKAAQERLFTKFYRVERSLTTGNRGTGLGLYICRTIVKLHHGEIGVTSTEDQGATFFFRLPIFNDIKNATLLTGTKEMVGAHGWIKKRSTS